MSSHLKQRLILSTVGIFFLFFAVYYSFTSIFQPIFVLLNTVVICLALLEYYHLGQQKGYHPLIVPGIITSIAYIFFVYLNLKLPHLEVLPMLILFLGLGLFFIFFFNNQAEPLVNLALTLFGIAYLVIPLSCILQINYFFPIDAPQDGRLWLAYVFAVTKACDTGAYFFGKTFGRHSLAPHISPKKTMEGAIGGLLTTLLVSLLFFWAFNYTGSHLKLTLTQSIWLGILIGLLSQFGDLTESILKRDAGVKDSNNLPGLGGMLDIVDSLVFTLPFMYLMLRMGII